FFSSRRRHTRLQGDWSSDVCSSDLYLSWLRAEREDIAVPPRLKLMKAPQRAIQTLTTAEVRALLALKPSRTRTLIALLLDVGIKIGRASCRERGGNEERGGASNGNQ